MKLLFTIVVFHSIILLTISEPTKYKFTLELYESIEPVSSNIEGITAPRDLFIMTDNQKIDLCNYALQEEYCRNNYIKLKKDDELQPGKGMTYQVTKKYHRSTGYTTYTSRAIAFQCPTEPPIYLQRGLHYPEVVIMVVENNLSLSDFVDAE